MTINELLEQMKINWETYYDGDGFVKHISFNEEQFNYLIQEVEALVRKDVIEEVRDLFIDDEVQESKSFSEIKNVIENRGTYNAYDEDGNKLNKKPIIITRGKLF